MKRRTFITALTAFAGSLALGDLRLTRAFSFVQRRAAQVAGTTMIVGQQVLELPIPEARKGDLLVATVATYYPDDMESEWCEVPGWNLVSLQEMGGCAQQVWYKSADDDRARNQSLKMAVNGKHSVGQVYVFRGVETEPRAVELYPDSIDIETIDYHYRK